MLKSNRRTFLKVAGGVAASAMVSSPVMRAFADGGAGTDDEFFIFIHAAGGWDVTLSTDPRPASTAQIELASTDTIDPTGILHWGSGDVATTYRPAGSNITFGPAIGNLASHYDKLLVLNGVEMSTVSHPDGTAFSSTGRHLAGGRASQPSIDTVLASEYGTDRLFPLISVNYPSYLIGNNLDARATPLRVNSVASVATSLQRNNTYEDPRNRLAVTTLLAQEADDLARAAYYPDTYSGMRQQLQRLPQMLSPELLAMFNRTALLAQYPDFNNYLTTQVDTLAPVNAAFAVEAIRQKRTRCISFAVGSFDTHFTNYRQQPLKQQQFFNVLAQLITYLENTRFADESSVALIEKTHILVTSDFCRTPMINNQGGRDHWPNNTTLIISPKFIANAVRGATDPQLLPSTDHAVLGGTRSMNPADILTTYMSAFGVSDTHSFMRDGEVIPGLVRA